MVDRGDAASIRERSQSSHSNGGAWTDEFKARLKWKTRTESIHVDAQGHVSTGPESPQHNATDIVATARVRRAFFSTSAPRQTTNDYRNTMTPFSDGTLEDRRMGGRLRRGGR